MSSDADPTVIDPNSAQDFALADEWSENQHENFYQTPAGSLTVFQIMLLRSLESIAQQLDRIRQRLDANAEGK